ncbi:heparinase II/III-family protein [Acidimicrobiia bacterium]|nr:heparinase II/III-family protein [Acidimicrobiia bacterium]
MGGHSHYDQLSIECFTDNKWIARDPGTGTYTVKNSSPRRRTKMLLAKSLMK